jgi:hypothetical protein
MRQQVVVEENQRGDGGSEKSSERGVGQAEGNFILAKASSATSRAIAWLMMRSG